VYQVQETTSYYATAQINSHCVNNDVRTTVNEIIEHLTGQIGTQVVIMLEISASQSVGFDEDTVQALKFRSHGFGAD
jgi:hypothetical protein